MNDGNIKQYIIMGGVAAEWKTLTYVLRESLRRMISIC